MITSTIAVMLLVPILFVSLKERALRRGKIFRDFGSEGAGELYH
jgi:hypothetical protein